MERYIVMKMEDPYGWEWRGALKVEEPNPEEKLEKWCDTDLWWEWVWQKPFGKEFEVFMKGLSSYGYNWKFYPDGKLEVIYYKGDWYGAPYFTLQGEWKVAPQEEVLDLSQWWEDILSQWEDVWEASLPPEVFWKFLERERKEF